MKMRYSIESRDKTYVKGYGFLSFAKNIGKNVSNKYKSGFKKTISWNKYESSVKIYNRCNKNRIKKKSSKNS